MSPDPFVKSSNGKGAAAAAATEGGEVVPRRVHALSPNNPSIHVVGPANVDYARVKEHVWALTIALQLRWERHRRPTDRHRGQLSLGADELGGLPRAALTRSPQPVDHDTAAPGQG
eukprot:242006-Chlamydomonas_euryale.AAC.5